MAIIVLSKKIGETPNEMINNYIKPGISTNKIPPRGPVGLNQLVSYKYEVLGQGQIRK